MSVLGNTENGNQSSKSLKVHFDFAVPKVNKQEEYNISRQNSRSSSSSYYSSPSPEEDEEDDDENSPPESVVTDKDVEFSLQPNNNKQSGSYCDDSIFSPDISPQHLLPLWSPQNMSPMQSPLCLAPSISSSATTATINNNKSKNNNNNNNNNGYDPNRIPASIFSSKPSNPMEWSSTSNESLFSLHLGNTSFSKDQFLMLYKSGELNKLDEVINVPPFFPRSYNNNINNNNVEVVEPSSSSSQITADQIFKSLYMEIESSESASNHSKESNGLELHYGTRDYNKINSNIKYSLDGMMINRRNMAARRNNSNSHLSYRSDESYNSTRSFNFPVFGSPTGESSKRYTAAQSQPQPLMEMLRKHERSRVFERRPKSFLHRWLSNLGCFSFCSTRRTGHLHDY